jgi:hypothetical protein
VATIPYRCIVLMGLDQESSRGFMTVEALLAGVKLRSLLN